MTNPFAKRLYICGTVLWNLGTFSKSGTCMWNLGEPGARFPAAAPNHPEALLEEPQAFQAVGEKFDSNSRTFQDFKHNILPNATTFPKQKPPRSPKTASL